MTTSIPFHAGAVLAPLCLLLLSPGAEAQRRPLRGAAETGQEVAAPAAAPQAPVAIAADGAPAGLFFDEPGDGNVWARGDHYKASFGPAGATYFPGFGPRQPHNLPHALSPVAVTSGGAELAFQRGVQATRSGARVELDRGAFVEAYELRADGLEQLFVFPSLPGRGDLALTIPVASELAGVETGAGIEFRGELGRVT
jgi:hypothetical protein